MSETMPENIWVSLYEGVKECHPKGYWPGGKWPAVFKQNRDRATPYRLKSTVDAEREADSKTIRELAAALGALADDMDIMAYNYAERHFVAKRKDPIASRFYDAIDSFLESWCEFRRGINWSAGDSTPRPDKAYERLKKNNVNPDYKNVGETALATHAPRIAESQEGGK